MKFHLVYLAALFKTITAGQSHRHREEDIKEQKGGLRKRLAAAHDEIPYIDQNLLLPRNLQELPCNVPFKTMTTEDIKATLSVQFNSNSETWGIQEFTSILDDKVPLAEFDVQFMKVSNTVPLAAGQAISM